MTLSPFQLSASGEMNSSISSSCRIFLANSKACVNAQKLQFKFLWCVSSKGVSEHVHSNTQVHKIEENIAKAWVYALPLSIAPREASCILETSMDDENTNKIK